MAEIQMTNTTKTIPRPPIEHARLEAGFLGRFVGVKDNAMINISGLVCIILTLSVIGFVIFDQQLGITYAQIVTPVISGIIGFFFGRRYD